MATPSSLLKYRQQERILLSDVSHLVLDEADTLLDESFVDATTSIVRAIKLRAKKPPKFPDKAEDAQVTVVGATLSDHVIDAVEKLVPVSSCNPGQRNSCGASIVDTAQSNRAINWRVSSEQRIVLCREVVVLEALTM